MYRNYMHLQHDTRLCRIHNIMVYRSQQRDDSDLHRTQFVVSQMLTINRINIICYMSKTFNIIPTHAVQTHAVILPEASSIHY